jgi:hypothetical protein
MENAEIRLLTRAVQNRDRRLQNRDREGVGQVT